MTALVVQGDARRLPLPDGCVDLIVTSPPYFALRSYQDAGQHYEGQIGSEQTPAEYLDALWACTAEWMRVLKPEGSMFVNLGDKYAQSGPEVTRHGIGGHLAATNGHEYGRPASNGPRPARAYGARPKSLLGIPWRYAIGCIDQLGLILRAEIIWSKPNGLPESVTDRVRRSHENWFHFVKQPRYYAAVDEIREVHSGPWKSPGSGNPAAAVGPQFRNGHSQWERTREERDATVRNPLGKLPGSVWSIPSEPLTVPDKLGVDHFAAFPTEWPRRLILGWSPPGLCTVCGQGRRPVVEKDLVNVWHDKPPVNSRYVDQEAAHLNNRKHGDDHMMRTFGSSRATITGYVCGCDPRWSGPPCVMCNGTGIDRLDGRCRACNGHGKEPSDDLPPTRPAVVLDPFGGTGTTALVAHVLGRVGITVDMSGDYSRLARWRCTDRGELAKAMRVEKPKPVPDGQMEMFA